MINRSRAEHEEAAGGELDVPAGMPPEWRCYNEMQIIYPPLK